MAEEFQTIQIFKMVEQFLYETRNLNEK